MTLLLTLLTLAVSGVTIVKIMSRQIKNTNSDFRFIQTSQNKQYHKPRFHGVESVERIDNVWDVDEQQKYFPKPFALSFPMKIRKGIFLSIGCYNRMGWGPEKRTRHGVEIHVRLRLK